MANKRKGQPPSKRPAAGPSKASASGKPAPATGEPAPATGESAASPPSTADELASTKAPAADKSAPARSPAIDKAAKPAGAKPSATSAREARRRDEREARAAKIRDERARDLGGARAAGAPEPAFWFGFELPWAKLVAARVAIFALLAIDAIMQIRHAPRYGAGGFNVGQLPGLGALAPGRAGYEVAQLVEAYLFVLIACGVATRALIPAAAAIYAWLYFSSQLDSYQHHYLVALLLALASFVPWQRPPDATPSTPVRSWALRLILVQLAIMYGWAAISKLDPLWLDGRTLGSQLTGWVRSLIDHTAGLKAVSVLVVGAELALAATIWRRPTWIIAAPLGVLFHLGIAVTGLDIGLFAFLMLAMYLLVIPDRWWLAVATSPPGRAIAELAGRAGALRGWPAWLAALAAGTALALAIRLPAALPVAACACAVPIVLAVRGRGPALAATGALAHLLAIGLWLAVDRASTVAFDYYRFWGGSQRRLGSLDQAERAYRALIDLAPGDGTGPYQLGRILLATGRTDDGLALLHDAQRLEPDRARALLEEARWLAQHGRTQDAIAKARQAAAAEPASDEARALLARLTGGGAAPKPTDVAAPSAEDAEAP